MQPPRIQEVPPPKSAPLREPVRRPNKEFNIGKIRPLEFEPLAGGGGTVSVSDATATKEPEAPFGYTVGGVVIGARPAAVFRDAAGNQKLVMVGGSLDGDSTVKAVRMDHVVVIHKGKSLRLKVGGDTVAK
jgi:type II secretory pathway component PulC